MFVEGAVMRVREAEVVEALVRRDGAVANDLDFGLVGHGLEIWVEDAAFGVKGFPVAVALTGFRVEALSQLVLSSG